MGNDLEFEGLLRRLRSDIRASAYKWCVKGFDDPENLSLEGEAFLWEFKKSTNGWYPEDDPKFIRDFKSSWRKKLIDRARYVRRHKRNPKQLVSNVIETGDGLIDRLDLYAQSMFPSPLDVVEASDLLEFLSARVREKFGDDASKIIDELVNPELVPAIEFARGLVSTKTRKWILVESLKSVGISHLLGPVLGVLSKEISELEIYSGTKDPEWVSVLRTIGGFSFDSLNECADAVIYGCEFSVGKTNRGRWILEMTIGDDSAVSRFDTFDELLRDLYEILINLED